MQLQHVIKLKLSSQLIGQFGHVTASASCKQPEKHGNGIRFKQGELRQSPLGTTLSRYVSWGCGLGTRLLVMSCRSSHVTKLKLSSQLIGQFGHVTASASCKQPVPCFSGCLQLGNELQKLSRDQTDQSAGLIA